MEAVLNPRGVRFVAGAWSLEGGECRSLLEVRTHERQSIPALDWLASEKLSDDLLQAVPSDAFYTLAVPVSDALRRLDVREPGIRPHDFGHDRRAGKATGGDSQ